MRSSNAAESSKSTPGCKWPPATVLRVTFGSGGGLDRFREELNYSVLSLRGCLHRRVNDRLSDFVRPGVAWRCFREKGSHLSHGLINHELDVGSFSGWRIGRLLLLQRCCFNRTTGISDLI